MKRILPVFLLFLCSNLMAQPEEASLLGTWKDPSIIGSSWYNNAYNEVWGLVVEGVEYAVIGSTEGTHFLDISDPTNPVEVARVAGAVQGGEIVHRDYHDYKGYLYVACDEGPSTLQIMDITQLPDTVTVVYDSAEAFSRAHNIFIDTATAKMYTFATAGGNSGYSPLRIYDLTDPVNPVYVRKYNNFGNIYPSHVHDGYVRNDVAFLNCGGHGFAVVDFSDPYNPRPVSTLTSYVDQGYNHSGWLSDDAQYYYMADEDHDFDMKVVDFSDPCDMEVVGTFNAEASANYSIPHNQLVACNYLYVSYYYDGMQVYDISDPANPERVLYYNTSQLPHRDNYEGAWGVYPYLPSGNILVSDMQEGLFVLQGVGESCDPDRELTPVDLSCLTPTSTSEQSAMDSWKVFPQPASDVLHVELNTLESMENVEIELLDLTGSRMQTFEKTMLPAGENHLELNLKNGLPSGMYSLRLVGENVQLTKKVSVK